MNLTLNDALLRRLFNINSFPLESSFIIVGFRGCLPVGNSNEFAKQHELRLTSVNHVNPRCTMVQWKPATGEVAVFAASTVPHNSYMEKAKAKNGLGANQLITGFFPGYTLGKHNPGKPTEHDALRQTMNQPVRRTADDLDYDGDDRIEVGNPCDNIHAGWAMGVDSNFFGSAGCQVIVGYPASKKLAKATGPYATFIDNIFDSGQQIFDYALFTGSEASRLTTSKGRYIKKFRYGSQDEQVGELQEALKKRKFYNGKIDNDFGPKMLEAVCKFQEDVFGKDADDGIVGEMTAGALDIKLNSLYYYDAEKFELVK